MTPKVAILVLCLALSGCGGTAANTSTTNEHREANPVAEDQELLAKQYMHNEINEAQYHEGLAAIKRGGEEAVCRRAAEAFPNNCNPNGTVKK